MTGSEDKTVRAWSLPEGKLIRTYRPPIGEGDFGKIYATAISPDGKRIAAGGWDAYLTSRTRTASICSTARPTARCAVTRPTRSSITWRSPRTARRLAVALDGKNGVRIIDAQTGKVLLADRDYAERSRGLGFRAGRLRSTRWPMTAICDATAATTSAPTR